MLTVKDNSMWNEIVTLNKNGFAYTKLAKFIPDGIVKLSDHWEVYAKIIEEISKRVDSEDKVWIDKKTNVIILSYVSLYFKLKNSETRLIENYKNNHHENNGWYTGEYYRQIYELYLLKLQGIQDSYDIRKHRKDSHVLDSENGKYLLTLSYLVQRAINRYIKSFVKVFREYLSYRYEEKKIWSNNITHSYSSWEYKFYDALEIMQKDTIMKIWEQDYDIVKEPQILPKEDFIEYLLNTYSCEIINPIKNDNEKNEYDTELVDVWQVNKGYNGLGWLFELEYFYTDIFGEQFYYLHRSWVEMHKLNKSNLSKERFKLSSELINIIESSGVKVKEDFVWRKDLDDFCLECELNSLLRDWLYSANPKFDNYEIWGGTNSYPERFRPEQILLIMNLAYYFYYNSKNTAWKDESYLLLKIGNLILKCSIRTKIHLNYTTNYIIVIYRLLNRCEPMMLTEEICINFREVWENIKRIGVKMQKSSYEISLPSINTTNEDKIINELHPDLDKESIETIKTKINNNRKKIKCSFRGLVNEVKLKEKGKTIDEFMIRLHELIDGAKAAEQGHVICRALIDGYLTMPPDEKTYNSEFLEVIGTWEAKQKCWRNFKINNVIKQRAMKYSIF